ncbi:hypothetical protein KRMM14A1259_06080 [Krasilnikovia sp. MM14-A1259]
MWKIVAVRPVFASHRFNARSRGTALNAPAAAPQSTPQDGTSFASVTQAGAVGVTVGVGAGGTGTGTGSGPPHATSPMVISAAVAQVRTAALRAALGHRPIASSIADRGPTEPTTRRRGMKYSRRRVVGHGVSVWRRRRIGATYARNAAA